MADRRSCWMRVVVVLAMLSLYIAPVFSEEMKDIVYVGGSSKTPTIGSEGRLDVSTPNALTFRSEKAGVATENAIPYAKIRHFEHYSEVAHHLGVLPAIAVGLVAKRRRKHFFTISYTDAQDVTQVMIFEVPRADSSALLAILRARAAQACGTKDIRCGERDFH